jgi:cytochrome c biogenesis protein CcmG/thiol:disulfide interchange protein DsbE
MHVPPSSTIRRHGLRLAALTLSALVCLPVHALEAGQNAPEFDLQGRLGAIKLSDFRGKTVYLDFWASWCGPCKQSFPWMNTMQARYASKGLRVIAVNLDQKGSDATAFLAENPASFAIAFDPAGNTPRSYAIVGMPTSVLIGPDGKILLVHSGFKADQGDALERQIKHSLNLKDQ